MRPALAVWVLALALALAACGAAPRDSARDFSGAERDVAATVEDVESAARDKDSGAVCTKLLTDRLLAAVERRGMNCTTAVKDAFNDADMLDLTVDDVSISGDKATANVTSGSGSKEKKETLELEKVGSGWKIDLLRS